MSHDSNMMPYHLTVYSSEFRWSGELAIPMHRRLSDYLNDPALATLTLTQVTHAIWQNDTLRELQTVESSALIKRNLSVIVSDTDAPAPQGSSMERIRKLAFGAVLHLPPYTLIGELKVLHNADWLHVVSVPNEEFFPITNANLWRTQTGIKLETDLKFALVNRQRIHALEPKR